MALSMTMYKSGVKFTWDDGVSKTVVELDKNDDQESACRKLRKVLSLAESEKTQARDKLGDVFRDAAERSAAHQSPTNGWKKYEAPQVPDRLQGEVELIDPEVTSGEQ